jgi:hypothetical protein
MSGGSLRGDRHVSSRQNAEIDARLRESIRASGLEGKPLQLQSSPFSAAREGVASIVGGMLGPPAWAIRLKQLHDGRIQLAERLHSTWCEYARRYRGRPQEFARRWRAFVLAEDLTVLNTLIKKHNDYYPIEARLPIVYPKGTYLVPAGIEYPQQPIRHEELLEEYPADLDMALYFAESSA